MLRRDMRCSAVHGAPAAKVLQERTPETEQGTPVYPRHGMYHHVLFGDSLRPMQLAGSWKNVISLGDGPAERQALQEPLGNLNGLHLCGFRVGPYRQVEIPKTGPQGVHRVPRRHGFA